MLLGVYGSIFGDKLRIYFCSMKNDQLGERKRDPCHCYASPFNLDVCPILSLGLYFAWFPDLPRKYGELFPGNCAYNHFSTTLNRVLEENEAAVVAMGHNPKHMGCLSSRKGSGTHCMSGSTAGPSGTAMNSQAGWMMGTVQDNYLWFEQAGDQYTGRCTTGLPVNSYKFTVTSPFFFLPQGSEIGESDISEGVSGLFGSVILVGLDNIFWQCFALLLYLLDF